jgi:hypothetical protein
MRRQRRSVHPATPARSIAPTRATGFKTPSSRGGTEAKVPHRFPDIEKDPFGGVQNPWRAGTFGSRCDHITSPKQRPLARIFTQPDAEVNECVVRNVWSTSYRFPPTPSADAQSKNKGPERVRAFQNKY